MTEHEAARTLVKSPPELWAECSDATSLARHLTEFGEIRITRLEPENAVAWEGTLASGTVRLEPSGWGTRVILTARENTRSQSVLEPAPDATAEVVAAPEPEQQADVGPEASEPGFDAAAPASELEPVAAAEPEAAAAPEPAPAPEVEPVAATAPPAPAPRPGLLQRLLGRLRGRPAVAVSVPAPTPVAETVAEPVAVVAEPEPEPVVVVPAPEPVVPESVVPEPEPVAAAPEPEPVAVEPERVTATPEPEPEPVDHTAVLTSALDSLGQAHHRPFSRS